MSKCFISYGHGKRYEKLPRLLQKKLEENGIEIFIDTKIPLAQEWPPEIEQQIESSDFFIVILTDESIYSDWVKEEVRRAYDLYKKEERKFFIIPIYVDLDREQLEFELSARLTSIQSISWKRGMSYNGIVEKVLEDIEKYETTLSKAKTGDQDNLTSEPPHPHESPTGTVKLNSPYYIKRKADEEILEQIKKNGSTTIVKGAHQIGKSSLMVRAKAEAKKLGRKLCSIDFQMPTEQQIEHLDSLFRYLALRIAEDLEIKTNPNQYWSEELGPKEYLSKFIENEVLKKFNAPVLISFDEVDKVFKCLEWKDFFSTIKGWANRMGEGGHWEYLNILIAHSTEPSLWTEEINKSFFDIGHVIKLENFNIQQMKYLSEKYGLKLEDEELNKVMDFIGGQPRLSNIALDVMKKNNYSLSSQLENVSKNHGGPFNMYLKDILRRLHNKDELKKSIRQVLEHDRCPNETHFLLLMDAGLVKGETRNKVQMCCQLYKDYFRKHL